MLLITPLNPDKPVVSIKIGPRRYRRVATPEYRSWQMMKNRCLNPRAQDYQYYGARGVTVCPQWVLSFRAFWEDMGDRPGEEYTLDRINNDEGYAPQNCRWATRKVQSRNRDYCRLDLDKAEEIRQRLSEPGVLQLDLAIEFGVSPALISQIARRKAWR